MPRIEGYEPKPTNVLMRLIYGITRKKFKDLTGTATVAEPVRIMAHHPRVLLSVGAIDMGLEGAKSVPKRYVYLAFTRAARLIGCPF